MDLDLICKEIKQASGCHEVARVTHFNAFRNSKKGGRQQLSIEIHEAGSDSPPQERFRCSVKSDDGKTTSGNWCPDVGSAIAFVHWNKLDD